MAEEAVSKNFIEQEIEKDLAEGVYDHVCTRFPPEPNGYLHIGMAAVISLIRCQVTHISFSFLDQFDCILIHRLYLAIKSWKRLKRKKKRSFQQNSKKKSVN